MKLADIFCDNMVLQRGDNTFIFGTGSGNGVIEFLDNKIEFKSENDRFVVLLPTLKAGDVFDITVTLGEEKQIIKNVIVGDVYIAGGQSNMAFTLGDTVNIEFHNNPDIRYYCEPTTVDADMNIMRVNKGWRLFEGEDVLDFSAVAYYFAIKLNKKTGVPVGILACNMGASAIQSWVSKETSQKEVFKEALKHHDEKRELYKINFNNWLYYNKLLNVVPYTAKAVLWYQGEHNTEIGEAEKYCGMLKELIYNWRDIWNCNFPFYIVQLMPFLTNHCYSDWAMVRNEQLKASKTIEDVYMVTMFDTGEANDIHPKNKKCVGEALSNAVMNTLFGFNEIEYCGPIVESCIKNGNTAEITFSHADGLRLDCIWFIDTYVYDKNGIHYEVNGRTATGEISGNKLYITWNDDIEAVGMKMGYWNTPMHKLKNSSGYLASPFNIEF